MHGMQVPQTRSIYRQPMANEMLPWLARAARELREDKDRKLVNVASSTNRRYGASRH